MNYLDGFRDPRAARVLRKQIDALAASLPGRSVSVMEVCGTHTMAIGRYGIRQILPANVVLVSGPGCPVCVTDPGYIDTAIELARNGVHVMTFGDMIHVPGSESTLTDCRSRGGVVEVCYSPAVAVAYAEAHPGREVVFLAIGFETTIAPVVSIVDMAVRRGVNNLSLLVAFKRVPPALRALLTDPEINIDAFLCPAHVSVVIGSDAYKPFTGPEGVPCVVAGFEPLDILLGLQGILAQVAAGESRVENQYSRVVTPGGNRKAQERIAQYLEPADARWRGIGVIPRSGYALRAGYARYDAEIRHGVRVGTGKEHPGCLCGEVIKGKIRPTDCPLFAGACTPDYAVGPCMVSAEGTCAAYYKYSR